MNTGGSRNDSRVEWQTVRLDEVATIVGGDTPSRRRLEFWDGDIPWLTPSDLAMPGQEITNVTSTSSQISEAGLSSCSAKLLPVGTVLFSSRATIGKLGISQIPLATNQGFANFIPRPGIDKRFLAYSLQYHTPTITALAGSTTFKEVSKKVLRGYRISLPPISEQRLIVEILGQASRLRDKHTEAERRARQIVPALFYRTFGDPATNPMEWPRAQLGEVLTRTQYGSSTKANTDGEGIPILRMNNIDYSGRLDLSDLKHAILSTKEEEKLRLEPGDVLFNRTNSRELVGKTALWQGAIDAIPASYLIRIVVDQTRVCPEYIWSYMNTPYFKRILYDKARRAIGMANINATELRSMPVVVPKIETQRSFVAKLRTATSVIEHSLTANERIDRLFRVLLYQAFSGDLTASWRTANTERLLVEMQSKDKLFELSDDDVSFN